MVRHTLWPVFARAFCLLWLAGYIAHAQDPVSTNTQTSSTPAASQPTKPSSTDKPKKVWTNDDIKSTGSVSVIGDPRNQRYTMTKPPDPATIAKYRANLQKLQAQLNDVNQKLQQFQDFVEGKPASEGGSDLSRGYNRTPVNQQVAKLQDKKKQLQTQIDDLYESARKIGIESGDMK